MISSECIMIFFMLKPCQRVCFRFLPESPALEKIQLCFTHTLNPGLLSFLLKKIVFSSAEETQIRNCFTTLGCGRNHKNTWFIRNTLTFLFCIMVTSNHFSVDVNMKFVFQVHVPDAGLKKNLCSIENYTCFSQTCTNNN